MQLYIYLKGSMSEYHFGVEPSKEGAYNIFACDCHSQLLDT